ncbi:MAG: hypothetical protein COU33_04455 [Candidatus Magasanikbacteria bacterium CG10_big_fil_rev_8_21_14_0_10_43_6]|uniref:Uncharacterized protein n=1 Tax=Candidatus Magasanikbacteria bacterium CG10_big_fil_rev_8_21_14_0_10_43_6 TaxID=1974650 RepID=A0A2M6W0A4_9BACT|nr:MAG: hypothetical protein COU33_04455 [Candidatus Magasanikbacteria bacterium CG10_big_fil_rev_8_21_14_0_10_43_6]
MAIELLGILGVFFLLGYVLSKLQEATHNNYRNTIGWRGVLCTAWIGTPIHELGHIFFAKVFRHKLGEIHFFRPNKTTGELGHVEHSYDRRSLYQQIGNFFIGAAPMLFGSVVLVMLLYFLVPNAKDIFLPLATSDTSLSFSSLFAIKDILVGLFSMNHISDVSFWIFLYLSFCISAHIAPSKQDRKGMWKGFFWMVLVLIIFNIIPILIGINLTAYVSRIYASITIITALFLYTLIISTLHYLVSILVLALPYRLLRR